MPTILTHAVSGFAIGRVYRSQRPPGFWAWSAVCAMLPDADVIAFALGIGYGDLLGHRGLSHSFMFAALVGAIAAWTWRRSGSWPALFFHFFVVTASHGILDAFTNGGLGVAFLAPFDDTRYFFPWRPIQVSPIGPGFFTGARWLRCVLRYPRAGQRVLVDLVAVGARGVGRLGFAYQASHAVMGNV